jgi:hypothetical protein
VRLRGGRGLGSLVAGLAAAALLAPGGAGAATVVNGDFESGNLAGWHVHRATELGDWYAYKGTSPPIGSNKQHAAPVQAPPQGAYAAITDELNPDTLVLYQDVVLRPEYDHRLSLFAYYTSQEPIAIPTPDTLSVSDEALGNQANQQYRIDVIKPSAPLESIDPADILRTVFRTQSGDPREMPPTRMTADLSAFAGQTVRLRIVVAAHEETLNASVDAVAVDSAPPGQALPPLGSNRFSFGKLKLNRSNGTATLAVKVPGPGSLTAKGKGIKRATAKAAKAGTAKLRLKPTRTGLETLRLKHKLRVKVSVTFAPAGGSPRTATLPVVLKLAPATHRR